MSGHCMNCKNWKPQKKPRHNATYGTCVEYGDTTSYDSFCNARFVEAQSGGEDGEG